jgi:hypothetical protein
MTALLAQARAVTAEFVSRLVEECAKGVSDREEEAAALAGQCGLDVEDVQRAFARAREVNHEAKQAAARVQAKPYEIKRRRLTGPEAEAATFKKSDLQPAAEPTQMAQPKAEPEELDAEIARGAKRVAPAEPVVAPTAKVEDEASPKGKGAAATAARWPDAPEPPTSSSALERLTYPRGLLGHAVQYIYDTSALPDRIMALVGALSALAKALDRKVLGPTGNSVILFILLIAETGAGKQHIINCIRMLLRAMGLEGAIVASGIASVQSIEEILEGKKGTEGKPSALVVIDEYGSFLSRISSKGQTGNVSEIPSTLQTLWGWPPQLEWQGSIKVGKDVVTVHGPAFSIFGTSTERAYFTALKRKEVSSGFVNRHLLLNAGRGAARRVRPQYDWQQCPEWLVKALKEVAGKPAPIDNRPLMKDKWVVTDFRKIGWGPGAEDLWQHFENEIRDMPSVDDRELWIRAPDFALRCATVVAAFRGARVVEVEDLEWSIEFARHSTKQLANGLAQHMLEEYEQADLVEHIREEFRRKGVLTHGQIRKLCERKVNDHRKIDLAIDHLMKVEHIAELESAAGPGRPTRRWQWNA